MSTTSSTGSVFSSLGNSIISALTGTDVNALEVQAEQGVQQLQLAIGTMIVLEAIIALELLILVVQGSKH